MGTVNPAFAFRGAFLGGGGANVHRIQDETGAKLWLTGDPGRPMSVEVRAGAARDLKRAVQMTEDLLMKVYGEYERWCEEREGPLEGHIRGGKGARGGGAASVPAPRAAARKRGGKGQKRRKGDEASKCAEEARGSDGNFQEEIELEPCDPNFPMRARLLGSKGQNVHYIQDETGAKLWLHGEAGGPMRFDISAESAEVLDKAVELAIGLIGSAREEHDLWLKDRERGDQEKDKGSPNKRARSEKQSEGDQEGEHTSTVDIKDCRSDFPTRAKIIGRGGQNVHRIQDETKSKLWVQGDNTSNGEPMSLKIRANNLDDLHKAERMVMELLDKLYVTYAQWLEKQEEQGNKQPERKAQAALMDNVPPSRIASKTTSRSGSRRRSRSKSGCRSRSRSGSRWSGKQVGATPRKGDSKGSGDELRQSINVEECDPEYPMRARLIGSKGRNIHRIQDATRAKLWLVGDAGEPMHFEITAASPESLEDAVRRTEALIEENKSGDYAKWLDGRGARGAAPGPKAPTAATLRAARGPRAAREGRPERRQKLRAAPLAKAGASSALPPAPTPRLGRFALTQRRGLKRGAPAADSAAGSRGRGDGDGEVSRVIELRAYHMAFPMRSRLIGSKGKNVHYIQDDTGAKLWVDGDSEKGEAMKVTIRARNSKALKDAERLTNDLLDRLHETYKEWLASRDRAAGREPTGGRNSGREPAAGAAKPSRRPSPRPRGTERTSRRLDLRQCDKAFDLKGRVLGAGRCNLQDIEDATGAKLHLRDGERLSLGINAPSANDLAKAVALAEDLARGLYANYDQWLRTRRSSDPLGILSDRGPSQRSRSASAKRSRSRSRRRDEAKRRRSPRKGKDRHDGRKRAKASSSSPQGRRRRR